MYLVIDAAIVGRWVGVEALAAVGASSSVMFLVMGFCNGACAGFAIPVAQAFGAKDFTKMRAYVANAVRVAVVMSAVVTLLSLMFCRRILQLVNTPDEIFHDAYIFLMLQFATIPLTFGFNLFSGQIRALGNSRQPFYFLIASAVANVLLDVVLILWLGLGVEGPASPHGCRRDCRCACACGTSVGACAYSFRAVPSDATTTAARAFCSTTVCLWGCSSPSRV